MNISNLTIKSVVTYEKIYESIVLNVYNYLDDENNRTNEVFDKSSKTKALVIT